MVRLIALDIDGTLLDSNGVLPQQNIAAIAAAMEAGVEVVLATGRRYEFARSIFEQLPAPLTLILSNGAIVKTHAGETLIRHLLPRTVARTIIARAPEHRRSAAVLFDRVREGQIVYERVDWDHPRHGRFFRLSRPFISEIEPLEDALTEDPIQVMFTGGCAEMRALFNALSAEAGLKACATRHGDDSPVAVVAQGFNPANRDGFSVALTEYVHRDFSLVDVIRAGCSKGAALAELARERGVDRGQVLAIGDNLNDVQMLEFAGHPVLVANALPEMKARGWTVTASNDDAGVARAIETLVLRKAS
jgi:hydroxymethylpyrimidine pyrophosphatase-like HAD family hydrolase